MNPLLLILLVESLQLHYNAVASAKDFKCGNSMISDEWRNEILSLVNDYRRKVSKGEQEGSAGLLPTAKQMNELTWDCNVEAAAQKAAASCPSKPSPVPKYTGNPPANEIGYLKMTKTVNAKSCDASGTARTLLNTLWNSGAKKQADNTFKDKNFAQIAYDKITAFACTYQVCQSTNYYLLCFFNQKAPTTGNVYTKNDDTATYCGEPTCDCVNGLCKNTVEPALFTSTICGTGTKACAGAFSDQFRDIARNMSNYYRRLLATGWAKYDTKYAEPATKMIELQYDKVLEDSAIAKITDCPDTVTTTDGENFWKKTVTGTSKPEDAIKTAMAKWWNSFETRGFGDDRKNTNAVKSAANIAYDKATKIGCAVDACLKKGLLYILCKYDPAPGIKDVIYESGKTCSKCGTTANTKCSTLGGLCVKS